MSKLKHPLAIVIIWLLIGLGLLCSYWLWDWQVLSAIATWVLATSIGVAIWQIIEMRKSRQREFALTLLDKLSSKEIKDIQFTIYKMTSSEIKERKNLEKIEILLNLLEWVGLSLSDSLQKEYAVQAYRGTAIRAIYKLQDFIISERAKRGKYAEYAVELARLAKGYEQKHSELERVKLDGQECQINFDTLETKKLR